MLTSRGCLGTIFVCVFFLVPASSKECVKRDRCSCVFDDGSGMIDLSNVGSQTGFPQFYDYTAAVDPYMYSYNPCYAFSEGTCTDVAMCQYDYNLMLYYDIGDVDKVEFSYDGLNLVAVYTSKDGTRSSYITLICDPQQTTYPYAEVIGESTPTQYYMFVQSAELCLKPIPPDWEKSTGGSMSGGSILLIIGFVIGAVYLIAGATFMKVKQDAKGKDLIPNVGLWSSIPGLVKDGFIFTTALVCRKKYGYVST